MISLWITDSHRTIIVDNSQSPSPTPSPSVAPVSTKDEIRLYILSIAEKYHLEAARFLAVAICESGLNPAAVGDHGQSFGLFQIHLKSHKDVTREQALDPLFAVEWAAKKFLVAPQIWACYKK